MKNPETPEQRWGNRDYPYHQTGEVTESEYLDRLHPVDRSYLSILLYLFQRVANSQNTSLHTLAVGSSADLQCPEYRDIDLLLCPEKPEMRSYFAAEILSGLTHDSNFIVTRESPKGSAPILSPHDDPYVEFKLFALPVGPAEMSKYFKQFDMTFVGDGGGTFADVVIFHRSNNLAFVQLTV